MDNLTRIRGIGDARADKLRSIGIATFKDIADLPENRIAELDEALKLKNSILAEDWRGQARRLMAEMPSSDEPRQPPAPDAAQQEQIPPAPEHPEPPTPSPAARDASAAKRARLDRARPFNDILGSEPGFDGAVRYEQTGRYFGPDDVEVRKV